MATIKQSISLQDKMSSVFGKIQKSAKSTLSTFSNVTNGVGKMQEKMDSFSNMAGSVFKGIMGSQIVQQGIGMITGSLDSAISRLDTLNNYPKVMANLGINAEDAQASIDKMSDKLSRIANNIR